MRARSAPFSDVSIAARSNTANIFVGRAVGGSGLNETVAFNSLELTSGRSYVFTGIDGYNITFLNAVANNGNIASTNTFTNSSNGLLTFDQSNFWNIVDNTGSRLLIINGNAETLVEGSIIATPSALTTGGAEADHVFEKTSQGMVTIVGTSSTYTGGTFINQGTLTINQISGAGDAGGTLNGAAGGILALGSSTTTGMLNYLGAAGTGAGETTAKALSLGGTTGNGVIMANQSGTAPTGLIFLSNVATTSDGINNATTSGGVKTLFLAGNSPANVVNQLQGVISDEQKVGNNFNTNLVKAGNSTWLYSPSASNYVTSVLTAAATTTVATSTPTAGGGNSIAVANASTLAVGQIVTGTNIPTGSYITSINGNTITISSNIAANVVVASSTVLGFSAIADNSQTVVALAGANAINSNVIALNSVAGLAVGESVTTQSAAATVPSTGSIIPTDAIITSIDTANNTITISTNIALAVPTGTVLTFGQITNFTGNVTITGGTLQIQPTAASGNGSDVINDGSTITFAADNGTAVPNLTGNQSAGGTFQYIGLNGASSSENVGALIPTAGADTVQVTPGTGGTAVPDFRLFGYHHFRRYGELRRAHGWQRGPDRTERLCERGGVLQRSGLRLCRSAGPASGSDLWHRYGLRRCLHGAELHRLEFEQ